MTKVVALMSMPVDGYVADANDGVAEVFDWYASSGDVEVPTASTTSGMTFDVSAPSADHLRGLVAEVGAMLTGRRTFEVAGGWDGQHPWDVPVFVTHHVPDGWPRPGSKVQFVTDGIETAVARAKSAAGPRSVGVHPYQWPPPSPEPQPVPQTVSEFGTVGSAVHRLAAVEKLPRQYPAPT